MTDLRLHTRDTCAPAGLHILGRYVPDDAFAQWTFTLNGTSLFEFAQARAASAALIERVIVAHEPIDCGCAWPRPGNGFAGVLSPC